jgi:rod shape-determining protein MreC
MDLLAEENAKLKEKLINYGLRPTIDKDSITIAHQRYEIIPAKIIKTSIDRAYNHVVLDKGKKDGIRPGMGVISDKGVIGIIKYVSDDFAGANSLLHRRTFISSAIKRTGAFGELKWMGTNPKYVNLTAIENHHTVLEGDTIITSAFSTHFPPNIMIGTVHETHVPDGSNFHHIDVSLDNDFSVLSHVYIIKNFKQQQQLDLEKEVSDE